MTTSNELPVISDKMPDVVYGWTPCGGDWLWLQRAPMEPFDTSVFTACRPCPLDDNGTTAEERRIKELEAALQNIVNNSYLTGDPRMNGATDFYGVPLDDIQHARHTLARTETPHD